MNDQQNIKVVQDAYSAFGRNDVNGILSNATNDIDWHTYGPAALPMGGPRKGQADVKKFFEQVGQAWNFTKFEPREFLASGDKVVVLGSYTGTAKSTSRPFASEFCHVFSLAGGKISKFREFTDTANLIGALAPATSKV
jgi:ketosteroid isomerase-like protein